MLLVYLSHLIINLHITKGTCCHPCLCLSLGIMLGLHAGQALSARGLVPMGDAAFIYEHRGNSGIIHQCPYLYIGKTLRFVS